MGAYGINQLTKADGGSVYEYADGGSVTSDNNIEAIINKLNPEQLQQAKQTALARRDMQTVEAIDQRLAELASEKSITQGIAGAMPQQMADGVMSAAGGGILAFEEGGPTSIELPQYAGNAELYKKFGNRAMESIDAYSKVEAPRAYTPKEEEALDARSMERAKKLIGPSPYAGMASQLEDIKTQGVEALRQGKGLAALAAMEGMLQPGGALRGLGRAGKNFAEAYAPAVRADQDLRKSTALMNINLANAQRAENMGLGKEAMAYTNQAIAARKEAGKAERELAEKEARLNIDAAKAFRPPSKGSGAGGASKTPKVAEQNYANILADLQLTQKPKEGESSAAFNARIAREASKLAVAEAKTSDVGSTKADLTTAQQEATRIEKATNAWSNMLPSERKAFARENGIEATLKTNANWVEQARKLHEKNWNPGGGSSAKSKNVINLDND
jgi:hypothetical protein